MTSEYSISFVLPVGPECRDASISWSCPGRFRIERILIPVPFSVTLEELRTCLADVWFEFAINGRAMLRIPICYMPSGAGPMDERTFVQAVLPTVIEAGGGDAIALGMHYHPGMRPPPEEGEEPEPPVQPLTRSIDVGVLLVGLMSASIPEGTE